MVPSVVLVSIGLPSWFYSMQQNDPHCCIFGTVDLFPDSPYPRLYDPPEVESRTQGSRPRPRPRTAFPRTDTLEAKDRNARGQGQGPRTQAQVLSKKKKNLHKNFLGDLQKNSTKKRFPKNFSSASQNFNNSKNSAVLEPRTGQFSRT